METKNSRWRNYGLWAAAASLILLILQACGVVTAPEQVTQYKEIINAVLGVLVLAGIVSNPTTENKGFSDDKGA